MNNILKYPLLRLRRWPQKNELRIRRLTSASKARRHLVPVEFAPSLNKHHYVAPSDSATGMGTRRSLPHPLCLCLGSLAASGPAKVVGLGRAKKWIADWHTDFGGPAAVGEATEATATGKAPGIQPPL